jgi:hypothetical protein
VTAASFVERQQAAHARSEAFHSQSGAFWNTYTSMNVMILFWFSRRYSEIGMERVASRKIAVKLHAVTASLRITA